MDAELYYSDGGPHVYRTFAYVNRRRRVRTDLLCPFWKQIKEKDEETDVLIPPVPFRGFGGLGRNRGGGRRRCGNS